jgi:hypothetical protein
VRKSRRCSTNVDLPNARLAAMYVYVLHHVHLLGDEEEVKFIGVYSTEK